MTCSGDTTTIMSLIRPTFYDFPNDPRCWLDCDEMMVGHSLLAAPVVEPNSVDREVYLPSGTRWYDFWSGEVFEGGQTINRPAPWSQPVVLARENCAVPVNVAVQTFTARADRRGFMIFPPTGSGAFTTENFEDDGESEAYRTGGYGGFRIEVEADEGSVSVHVRRFGAMGPDPEAHLILPQSEKRKVSISRS